MFELGMKSLSLNTLNLGCQQTWEALEKTNKNQNTEGIDVATIVFCIIDV